VRDDNYNNKITLIIKSHSYSRLVDNRYLVEFEHKYNELKYMYLRRVDIDYRYECYLFLLICSHFNNDNISTQLLPKLCDLYSNNLKLF